MVQPIKSLTISELEDIMRNAGLSAFRAQQILTWVYEKEAQT